MRLRSCGILKASLIGTALVAALLGGCKTDEGPDARVIIMFPDAPPHFDAPPTADSPPPSPDAPPAPTFGATILIQEIALLEKNGATVVPSTVAPGTGGNILVSFTQTNAPNAAQIVSGTLTNGCTATRYDGSAGKPAPPVLNEGTVDITVVGSGTKIPTCALVGGRYRCIGAQGTGGTAAAIASTPFFTVTDTTATSQLSADDVGRYLVYADGSKSFPIIGFAGAGMVNVAGPIDATVPAFFTLAGAGPVPATLPPVPPGAPPEFLANADTVDFKFTPGAGSHFAAFNTATDPGATHGVAVGDSWDFDDASKAALATGILTGTADVLLGCDMPNSKCGTALGTVIAIDSTDTTPTSPVDFPDATTKSANITCTLLGDGKITIPANQLALMKDASPKRIRIIVSRIGADLARALAGIQLAAGQGFVKFEDP
jgi:hypothetical protein